MEFKNIENPKKVVYCHFCEREVTKLTYIMNDETKVEICVSCFLSGYESESHKRTNPFRVIERLDQNFLEDKWNVYEELMLLEAMELFGYGNWSDIGTFMESKNSIEIEKHFKFCYTPFLDQQENYNYEERKESISKMDRKDFQSLVKIKNKQLKDQIEFTKSESERYNIGTGKTSIYGDIIGYMPLRREFDYEYDNDAELLLAEMEFTEEDSENDRSNKYAVLEIYNKKLQEREKRKNFVIDRNKLDIKKRFEMEHTMSEEERELRNSLKSYERFLTADEFEELIHCLIKEQEYKRNIERLSYLKKNGFDDFNQFEDVINESPDTFQAEGKVFLDDSTYLNPRSNKYNVKYSDKEKLDISNLCISNNDMDFSKDPNNLLIEEINLCKKYEIPHSSYLLVKEFLIRECFNNGFVDRERVKDCLKMEDRLVDVVFECLKSNESCGRWSIGSGIAEEGKRGGQQTNNTIYSHPFQLSKVMKARES